jgi:hypothetical protein
MVMVWCCAVVILLTEVIFGPALGFSETSAAAAEAIATPVSKSKQEHMTTSFMVNPSNAEFSLGLRTAAILCPVLARSCHCFVIAL